MSDKPGFRRSEDLCEKHEKEMTHVVSAQCPVCLNLKISEISFCNIELMDKNKELEKQTEEFFKTYLIEKINAEGPWNVDDIELVSVSKQIKFGITVRFIAGYGPQCAEIHTMTTNMIVEWMKTDVWEIER